MGDKKYWQARVDFANKNIKQKWELLTQDSPNPAYGAQFSFNLAKFYLDSILRHYSSGSDIKELNGQIFGLLDAWELSNKLAEDINVQLKPGQTWDHRHSLTAPVVTDDMRGSNDPRTWVFDLTNLNHYNLCFWLVGLALALEIPDNQWKRLVALIGGEGQDILLDKVIATRQLDRPIGKVLLHKKPYARLLKAIEAKEGLSQHEQAKLLRDFVDHWYIELARKGNEELWWYTFGDEIKHPLAMGSYFGRWCIEAVAAVKAFGLDDNLCIGHEHYPTALIHEEIGKQKGSWLKKLLSNN